MTTTPLHPDELIGQARDLNEEASTVLDACETFYGHGRDDEQSGDMEAPTGHFYRVNRWIVTTDSYGSQDLDEHGSVEEAEKDFAVRDREYYAWCNAIDTA